MSGDDDNDDEAFFCRLVHCSADDDDDNGDDGDDGDDVDYDDDCGNSAPLFCMQLRFQTSLNLD